MAKFLTYEDRLELEAGLKNHLSFTKIGLKLNRDRTTIAKEVRQYSIEQCTGYSVYPHNTCKYRKECRRKKVCGRDDCKHPLVTLCKQCESICNRYCEVFEEEVCISRFKAPYVCNGCTEVKNVLLQKQYMMRCTPRDSQLTKSQSQGAEYYRWKGRLRD